MNVIVGAKTDPGRRPNNEDCHLIVDTRKHRLRADGVLIIADGMGGRNFGEHAAAAAVETVQETLVEMLDSRRTEVAEPGAEVEISGVEIGDVLESSLRKANARVYEMARANEESKGMGTTCVAAVIEGDILYVANAGDSRAYLLRDGQLQQLTSDHSYVAEQVRAGAITEEGAKRSRFRNIITRAVGIEPTLVPDVTRHEVRGGDMVMLCTDGLSNMISEDDLALTLAQSPTPQSAADKLVQTAYRNGGKDNITAVVARLQTGTRTQRMHIADLSTESPETAEEAEEYFVSPPVSRRPSRLWPALAALFFILAVFGAASAAYLGKFLESRGYLFQSSRPYIYKLPPPLPPLPPDLAHVGYGPATVLFFAPVRSDLLTRNPADGSMTVATLSGAVFRLDPRDGKPLFKFKVSSVHPALPADAPTPIAPPLPIAETTLHVANDPQGNLYVADSLAHTITKYKPNGERLGLVAHSSLTNPQSLAVGDDGSVYVIDAERLKVLRSHTPKSGG